MALLVVGCFLRVCGQTNPVNVATIGTASGIVGGVAVSGNFAFLANNSGLQVFDISNPRQPTDVGYRDPIPYASWVELQGDLAYVANGSSLRIFDISSRTNPAVVGNITGSWKTVTVSGHTAFLAPSAGPIFEVGIYDVSNPEAPGSIGHFIGEPNRIATVGNYAYLMNQTLGVVDVSNPASPLQLGSTYCQGIDVAVSGHYAFAACWTNGLFIYDVSDLSNLVGVYHDLREPYCAVAVSGNYAYLAGDKLAVYDVLNPTNATLVGEAKLSEPLSSLSLQGLAVARGYAYVAYGSGLSVYSLGQPKSPSLKIFPNSTNVICSWPAPTSSFAVQQNPDLASTQWITLTNTPVVVGSQNEVTVTKPAGAMFYRLVSQ